MEEWAGGQDLAARPKSAFYFAGWIWKFQSGNSPPKVNDFWPAASLWNWYRRSDSNRHGP